MENGDKISERGYQCPQGGVITPYRIQGGVAGYLTPITPLYTPLHGKDLR